MGDKSAYRGVERRRTPRFQLAGVATIDCQIDGTANKLTGLCVDISEGGMSAFVLHSMPIGQVVKVQLRLATGVLTLQAAIRRKVNWHYGFEFVSLPAEQLAQIRTSTQQLEPFLSIKGSK